MSIAALEWATRMQSCTSNALINTQELAISHFRILRVLRNLYKFSLIRVRRGQGASDVPCAKAWVSGAKAWVSDAKAWVSVTKSCASVCHCYQL